MEETSKNNESTQLDVAGVSGSLMSFLDYEIRSSWWASWIGWNWGQEMAGKYFAWKIKHKYARFKQSKIREQCVKNYH